jgi:dienelactone hydrolase
MTEVVCRPDRLAIVKPACAYPRTGRGKSMLRTLGLLAVQFLSVVNAFAQPANPILAGASLAKDLEFPAKPSRLSFSTAPEMALYKPDGPGPFPALVLHHQCGGLGQDRWQNLSMLEWARQAVGQGYVALVIDSLAPRGVKTVCMGAQGGVNFPRGVRDALQAADHLRRLEFVDKDRIALAGYSWGAMVAVLASSQRWANALAAGSRFAAAVSFYPGCFTIKPAAGRPYEIVNADIDRPLLVLMGERDNETPPGECVPKLEAAKRAGAPVTWHVYPAATHCWDCKNLDGFSKLDFRGNQVVYRYDEDTTIDSARRVFDFLEKRMARPQ